MSIVGRLKLSPRIMCGDEAAIGPGKALVLEAVERAGSISGAGRDLGMSYRRIWLLVDSLNRCWVGPLVDTSGGGRAGSRLTPLGREVLARYRRIEAAMVAVSEGADYRALLAQLRDVPLPPAPPVSDPQPRPDG